MSIDIHHPQDLARLQHTQNREHGTTQHHLAQRNTQPLTYNDRQECRCFVDTFGQS